jgi:hypothetical protein
MGKSRERCEPHFDTRIQGIPAGVLVTYYKPEKPWNQRVFEGAGAGDCDPPEPAEIELRILDRQGYLAEWLENKMSDLEWREVRDEALARAGT